MADVQRDLPRDILAVLFIGALIGVSLWILRPFIAAIIWAMTIVVASWPVMLAVQARLWGKRTLAVMVMTLVLLGALILPFLAVIGTIVANADPIVEWVRSISFDALPTPPEWLRALPLVGAPIAEGWERIAAEGIPDLFAKAAPYADDVAKWFVAQVGNLGVLFAHSLLTIVIAAILYAQGETAAASVRRFAERLAGATGDAAVRLAAQAIRGVALGVVVTALIQAGIGGLGLAIAGVPFAAVLTGLMFFLAVAQLGAVPVLVPAVVWLYWRGDPTWGTFLLVVTVVVGTLDNILRPLLIKQGANLPLLLVFSGVIGGLIAFGLIGIFVGPVVLAVAYSMFEAWVNEGRQAQPAPAEREPR
ncbi:MAG: AI-2E family transporter YdiK [Nitrospirota bacterium]